MQFIIEKKKLLKSTVAAFTLLLLTSIGINHAYCQDISKARKIIDTLSSPAMFGRGYVNEGTKIAADYISEEMQRIGLKQFNLGYKQDFQVNVKTYPAATEISIDGKRLKPAHDFTIMSGSPSISGDFNLITIDSTWFKKKRKHKKLIKSELSNTMIMYDPTEMKGKYRRMADSMFRTNYLNCAGFIHLSNKGSLTWSVMALDKVLPYPILTIKKSALPALPKVATVNIELKAIDSYTVSNVTGYIEGSAVPDSFLVVTAHYDHLGMMGNEAMFPGANDNASGVAMMLDMAQHYKNAENKPRYSIVFMAFAGEEIGLKGSSYAAQFPLFPLKKIKFLVNLDMVGTGSEGITVVNGEQLPDYYNKLVKINDEKEYVVKVAKRGESCNSDHCPFYKKGVPAIFIYSMGKEHTEYHNPMDISASLPLTDYNDIFRLLRDFFSTF